MSRWVRSISNCAKRCRAELKHLQKSVGITFVYVTHDQEEALTMSDRIAVMNGGRVVQCGSPEEIYERPATRFVADFIGESNFIDGTICDLDASRAGIDVPGAGRIGATLRAIHGDCRFASRHRNPARKRPSRGC